MSSPGLVIRNGTIVDGRGGDPYEADLAVADGRIAAIGGSIPKGAEEIDARGKLVTPGFVDVHTHYDAQVTWSERLSPSSWNGATTVLLGNCGVGFAPCHDDQHDMLINLMEGVEDIPEVVMTAGLPWNWHSFPDYLDAIAQRRYDVDVATQVPHAALRVYVMGERGANREPATEADRRRMAELTVEGLRAGALGFSTSRTLNHRAADGRSIPTLRAEEAELTAIAHAMRETGAGWLQIVSDFEDQMGEIGLFRRLAKKSGRPITISMLQSHVRPDGWRTLLARDRRGQRGRLPHHRPGALAADQRAAGLRAVAEPVHGPAVLQGDRPSAVRANGWPLLRKPEFRARIMQEAFEGGGRERRVDRWDRMFPFGDPPDYEPKPESSIAARAAREGRTPEEVAYDLLLQRDGKEMLYLPVTNFAAGNLDVVREMIAAPNTLIGLGDGGAHVGIMCDATATSYTLTHWTRDRGGSLFPVAWAIKRLAADNAAAIGLNDRGVLKVGMKADINILDYDNMQLRSPEVVYDLPAGGKRLVQRTDGFDATIVSGAVVYRHGEPTAALPGRLVRGAREA